MSKSFVRGFLRLIAVFDRFRRISSEFAEVGRIVKRGKGLVERCVIPHCTCADVPRYTQFEYGPDQS